MLIGRKKELDYLTENFNKNGSRILVVYGYRGVGKTSLVNEFIKEHTAIYYNAMICSEKEQVKMMQETLVKEGTTCASYSDVFKQIDINTPKRVLVLDEFQNIVKYSENFMEQLILFLQDAQSEYLVLLVSSSMNFVENTLVDKIGSLARSINGFYKVPKLKYADLVKYFKGKPAKETMELYSLLGGLPYYWTHFDGSASVEENIKKVILAPNGALAYEASRLVSDELREMNVYNTLLSLMARGVQKLNDLHIETGYSRAKISVYMKNLMEIGLVEKVFSFEGASMVNAKKGVYRIADPFLLFYFRFVFANASKYQTMDAESFYQEYIAGEISSFHEVNFKFICQEYLELLNRRELLPFKADRFGEWVGKEGSIDVVMQNEDWDNILCFCNWKKPVFTYEDYENCLQIAKHARLTPDCVIIFSAGSYDERLTAENEESESLLLVDINTL